MRNYFLGIIVAVTGLLMFHSCAEGQGKVIKENLDAAEFKAAIEKDGITLIDVRMPSEYAGGHIAGAINIDWYEESFAREVGELDKNKPVYLYCAVGGRSEEAMEAMKAMGFREIHQLNGGVVDWRKQNYPVVK